MLRIAARGRRGTTLVSVSTRGGVTVAAWSTVGDDLICNLTAVNGYIPRELECHADAVALDRCDAHNPNGRIRAPDDNFFAFPARYDEHRQSFTTLCVAFPVQSIAQTTGRCDTRPRCANKIQKMDLASRFDGHDSTDLRYVLAKILFDPDPERHAARRTPDAGPMEPDAHEPFVGHFDKLDIAPVILHRGPDEVQDPNDPVMKW